MVVLQTHLIPTSRATPGVRASYRHALIGKIDAVRWCSIQGEIPLLARRARWANAGCSSRVRDDTRARVFKRSVPLVLH